MRPSGARSRLQSTEDYNSFLFQSEPPFRERRKGPFGASPPILRGRSGLDQNIWSQTEAREGRVIPTNGL